MLLIHKTSFITKKLHLFRDLKTLPHVSTIIYSHLQGLSILKDYTVLLCSFVNCKCYNIYFLYAIQISMCSVILKLYYNHYNTRQLLKSYATKTSLNTEISSWFNISGKSYMLLLSVYTKHDHAVHNFARSSNYASPNISKTVGNMDQTILLRYTNSI